MDQVMRMREHKVDIDVQDRSSRGGGRAAGRVAALVILLAFAAPAFPQKMPEIGPRKGISPGRLAHEFNLKDLHGRSYALKDLLGRGRVVHVVFWATWCFPCIEEIPHLREAYEKYHERGLEVLGVVVNISQTPEGVRSFVEDYKINYPVLFDDDGMADRYGVTQLPQNFLIGRDGIIRHAGSSLPGDYHGLVERMLEAGREAAGSTPS